MEIKQQLLQEIEDNQQFAFEDIDKNKVFTEKARRVLNSKTYCELEKSTYSLLDFIFNAHRKSSILSSAMKGLNIFEISCLYSYNKQRLHYIHHANVFFLGLYIYHKCKIVRESILAEMKNTTQSFGGYRYSDGTPYGEFLYRWRIASLTHDLGYGVSLSQNNENQISQYLKEIFKGYNFIINNFSDVRYIEGRDLLSELNKKINKVNLVQYYEDLLKKPNMNAIYHDHGLVGAVILSRLLNEEYKRHNEVEIIDGNRILYHRGILDNSIAYLISAIALHNIEFNKEVFSSCARERVIYELNNNPLCLLLKLADSLQEWDKPYAQKNFKLDSEVDSPNYSIECDCQNIIVYNFPKDKKHDLIKIINSHVGPSDIIEFRS